MPTEVAVASVLFRLGRWSFRRKWLVVAVWALLLALFGAGAATLSGPTSGSLSVPGTEAQRAIDLLAQRFPQAAAGGASARVVFATPGPLPAAPVASVLSALAAAPQVASVGDPFRDGTVSADGTVAYTRVAFRVPADQLTTASRDALAGAAEAGREAGLTVEMGGDAVEQLGENPAEIIGVGVAAIVLVVTFGSLLAAGLPLVTAILGIAIGLCGIAVASGFTDLSGETATLALMLGLAVGIDYALFVVSRYRHELAAGRTPVDAAGVATGTAGSAVVFAGLTVMIALAGLTVVGLPVLTQMGLAAAFTVGVAVVISLTLLPALFGLAGRRILGRRRLAGATSSRWAGLVTRRPVVTLVLAVAGLLAVALPALDLRLGLPDDGAAAVSSTQRKAYDLVTRGFGAGFNGPLTVVVDAADAREASTALADTVSGLPGVAAVSPPVLDQAGVTGLVTVVPASGPGSAATSDLVAAIRAAADPPGSQVYVTGPTAVDIDMSARFGDALGPYLAVVVGLSVVLLLLVFRSVVVPVKAALGFLLTVAATFGAVVAVFQWGWLGALLGVEQTGPVVSLLPVLLIGIVFGLAMDYQVFLVTRIREEHARGADPVAAIVSGLGHGTRAVSAAAIVMISVFAGFVLSDQVMIKTVGFALATAVAIDAFVVRMTIVPAVLALAGRAAWWLPRRVARLLPDLDVEGTRLSTVPDGGAAGRIDAPGPVGQARLPR